MAVVKVKIQMTSISIKTIISRKNGLSKAKLIKMKSGLKTKKINGNSSLKMLLRKPRSKQNSLREKLRILDVKLSGCKGKTKVKVLITNSTIILASYLPTIRKK